MRFCRHNARMICAGSERWELLCNWKFAIIGGRSASEVRCLLLPGTAFQCLHVYTLLASRSTWPPPSRMQAIVPQFCPGICLTQGRNTLRCAALAHRMQAPHNCCCQPPCAALGCICAALTARISSSVRTAVPRFTGILVIRGDTCAYAPGFRSSKACVHNARLIGTGGWLAMITHTLQSSARPAAAIG